MQQLSGSDTDAIAEPQSTPCSTPAPLKPGARRQFTGIIAPDVGLHVMNDIAITTVKKVLKEEVVVKGEGGPAMVQLL